MSSSSQTMVVGFPLYDQVTLLDFAGATQIFAGTHGRFEPVWLAPEMRPYQTMEKTVGNQPICITPQFTFKDPKRPKIDILFCPGGFSGHYDSSGGSAGYIGAMFDEIYQNFVIQVEREEAQWCGSVCTGAFVLAAAGLFDGCTATTYWSLTGQLRRFSNIKVPDGYPRALIELIEVDGVKKGRFSGGGISSSLDLALALVKHILGQQVAEQAQLFTQYSPDPIINFGDPDQASQGMVEESELVKKSREAQKESMIEPTRKAVTQILGE